MLSHVLRSFLEWVNSLFFITFMYDSRGPQARLFEYYGAFELRSLGIEQGMCFTIGLHVVGLFLLPAEACSYYERAPHKM